MSFDNVYESLTEENDARWAFGTGFDAVTPRKVAQLRALTSRWLAETEGAFAQVRIDVASVYTPPGGPVTLEYRAGVA